MEFGQPRRPRPDPALAASASAPSGLEADVPQSRASRARRTGCAPCAVRLLRLLLALAAAGQGAALVGGRTALPDELPWMVRLSMEAPASRSGAASRGLCSGTLVAPGAVLTAAHCLEREPDRPADYVHHVQMVAGTGAGRQERRAVRCVLAGRPGRRSLQHHDLALIAPERPFLVDGPVRTLSVANSSLPQRGARCLAAGFGARGLRPRPLGLSALASVAAGAPRGGVAANPEPPATTATTPAPAAPGVSLESRAPEGQATAGPASASPEAQPPRPPRLPPLYPLVRLLGVLGRRDAPLTRLDVDAFPCAEFHPGLVCAAAPLCPLAVQRRPHIHTHTPTR